MRNIVNFTDYSNARQNDLAAQPAVDVHPVSQPFAADLAEVFSEISRLAEQNPEAGYDSNFLKAAKHYEKAFNVLNTMNHNTSVHFIEESDAEVDQDSFKAAVKIKHRLLDMTLGKIRVSQDNVQQAKTNNVVALFGDQDS